MYQHHSTVLYDMSFNISPPEDVHNRCFVVAEQGNIKGEKDVTATHVQNDHKQHGK